MRKSNGFTLIELLIVIVIIAILAVVAWDSTREAGAVEHSPLSQWLEDNSVQFLYSSSGTLTIFNKGSATWESASAACTELRRLDSNLDRVVLTLGKEAGGADGTAELGWNRDHTRLTNREDLSEASCIPEPAGFGDAVTG